MSITEELRVWKSHIQTRLAPEAVLTLRAEINAIADRIDKEHAEAVADALQLRGEPDRWVELPVDANGVPIHVGDELTDGKVARLLICDDAEENSVYVYESPHVIKQIYCYEVVHRKPDSWERIIHDAFVESQEHFGSADAVAELVERCRRLAGERG